MDRKDTSQLQNAMPIGFLKGKMGAHMDNIRDAELPLIQRIERALLYLAYLIELDGDVHLPMFEKFEAELAELRRAEDARSRARRLLDTYTRDGGVKAIDCKNLSLRSNGGPLPYLTLPVR